VNAYGKIRTGPWNDDVRSDPFFQELTHPRIRLEGAWAALVAAFAFVAKTAYAH